MWKSFFFWVSVSSAQSVLCSCYSSTDVFTHTHSTKWRFCLIQIMSVRLHWSIPGDTFLNKDSNDFSGLSSFVPGQTVSCSLPFLLWWVWSLWFLQIFLSKFIRIWQKVHILMKKCSLNALISLEIWIVDSKSALCNLSCSPAQGLGSSSLPVHEMDTEKSLSSCTPGRVLPRYLLLPKLCQGRDELL